MELRPKKDKGNEVLKMLCDKELYCIYMLPSIIRIVKSGRFSFKLMKLSFTLIV